MSNAAAEFTPIMIARGESIPRLRHIHLANLRPRRRAGSARGFPLTAASLSAKLAATNRASKAVKRTSKRRSGGPESGPGESPARTPALNGPRSWKKNRLPAIRCRMKAGAALLFPGVATVIRAKGIAACGSFRCSRTRVCGAGFFPVASPAGFAFNLIWRLACC
ncbi:MAG: hypothetical protein A4E43_00623 [Methanosaeta sp. PtaB.Bin005]|nr:MAG: hypothetical protein A4E43_00623 [Methanosaeta sp. PtaB.Bin005]